MKKEVLTNNEANFLRAFGQASEAFLPELAVSARLTPSEVDAAVNGLIEKMLLVVENKKMRFVRLTPLGVKARNSWPVEVKRPQKTHRISDRGSLDTALEETIRRLSH